MSILLGDNFIGVDITQECWCTGPFGWGLNIAQYYHIVGGPFDGKWFWSVFTSQSCDPSHGFVTSQDEAEEACRACILIDQASEDFS